MDWSTSRASGKTFNFELWHAFTLKRIAALHTEFSTSFGNATAAKLYLARAGRIESVLRERYWNQDHWWTNYPGLFKDEMWYDDQVWSLYFKLSSNAQADLLFHRLATDGANQRCSSKAPAGTPVSCAPEGVPTMWNNRSRSGRDAETWFGRNGAGNIMARFAAANNQSQSWQSPHARQLLERISQVFISSGNIYESYDMAGYLGGDPGSNCACTLPAQLS